MIIGYFGNVRQGKTYSAMIELYKLYKKGYIIYSNTWLAFPYRILTREYLLSIIEDDKDIPDNCVHFIDEAHMFGLDSRGSLSKENKLMSYYLLQTGKMGASTDYGLILLFTSQYIHQIDRRLRSVIDIGIECEKVDYKGNKYFRQHIHVYKGSKSFSYSKIIKGTKENYALYDTRKRIAYKKKVKT